MERKERKTELGMPRMKGLCGIGADYSRKALIWSAPWCFFRGMISGQKGRGGVEHQQED